MRIASHSLWIFIGACLVLQGCGSKGSDPAATLQPGETADAAIARIQNDTSKSPADKVKAIEEIQRQTAGSQPKMKHKKLTSE